MMSYVLTIVAIDLAVLSKIASSGIATSVESNKDKNKQNYNFEKAKVR